MMPSRYARAAGEERSKAFSVAPDQGDLTVLVKPGRRGVLLGGWLAASFGFSGVARRLSAAVPKGLASGFPLGRAVESAPILH